MPSAEKERPTVPVAVIIPAYNMEQYIGETLSSVFSQTVRPLEVIVVNDGSKDRTAEIAREKGAVVHDQENRGPSAARNAGAARASAAWVAYLDGDDLWPPDKLERQWAAIMADSESGAVFTDFWQFDEQRCLNRSVIHEVLHHFGAVRRNELAPRIWRCNSSDLCDAHARQCIVLLPTLLIRRDLLLSIGGCDETLKFSEDVEFGLRLLARTNALFLDVPLYGYRRHASNTTRNRLRMRSGDIDVADRVLSAPSHYLSSTVAWYRRERPALMFKAGRMAVAYGDQLLARRWLSESWRAQKRASTLAWLLLSHLTDNAIGQRAMSSAKRAWFAYRAHRSRIRQPQGATPRFG